MSLIRVQARSTAGGPLDEETITCLDGRGRVYQTRTLIGAGQYQVSGFRSYNARGVVVEQWQPWVSSDGDCEFSTPGTVLSSVNRFDAFGRSIEVTRPGAAIYGEDIVHRTVYRPLVAEAHDAEDTLAGGPHGDTPVITAVDGLNRVVAVERAYGDGGAVLQSGETLHYDSRGAFAGYTDAQGHRHAITTDLAGRPVQVSNPNFGTIRYAYDDASNVVSITDARDVVQRRAYDAQNRIVQRYDEADREGTLVEWHYDVRPQFCPASECTNLPGQLAATTYPIRLVDGVVLEGADRIGYDTRRRPVLMSRSFGDLATLPTRMTYDEQDRVVSTTSPDGTVVNRTYDAAGRLSSLPDYVASLAYEDRGMLSTMVLANQARIDRGYDALMRLDSLRHVDGSGATFHDLTVARNRASVVTSVDDNGASNLDQSVTFGVDDWYRVTDASYADETEMFEMDVLDRIVARNNVSVVYDDARPLAAESMGSLSMAYDDGGYMVARNGMSLRRDELGRIAAVGHDGATTGVHAYAATERVLQMTDDGTLVLYGFDRYEVRDGVGTTFVTVGDNRVARRERTDFALTFYPDGNDNATIDAGDAVLAADGQSYILAAAAARLLVEQEDNVAFIHTDHLGSHLAATDGDGAVRGQQAFLLHGAARDAQGYVGAYGFTGQERDATTGLIHMAFRDLDPSTGRWDCFDPAFVRLGPDALSKLGEAATGYAYVANNASTLMDPSGLNGQANQAQASRAAGQAQKKKNKKKWRAKHESFAQSHNKLGNQVVIGKSIYGYLTGSHRLVARPNIRHFARNIGNGGVLAFFRSLSPFMVGERMAMTLRMNKIHETKEKRKKLYDMFHGRGDYSDRRRSITPSSREASVKARHNSMTVPSTFVHGGGAGAIEL